MTYAAPLLVAGCIALETVEQVLHRMAGRRRGRQYFAFVAPAVATHLLRLALWFVVLKVMPLGIAVPLMGTSYLTVALAGRVLFKEPVGRRRWAGTCVIVAGIVLIASSDKGAALFG